MGDSDIYGALGGNNEKLHKKRIQLTINYLQPQILPRIEKYLFSELVHCQPQRVTGFLSLILKFGIRKVYR